MLAATYDRPGPAREVLRVEELAVPMPGPDEVLVRLRTSGVNPSDWKTRRGAARGGTFAKVIPHSDGAGIIEEVGANVPRNRIGERVWIWNGQWRRAYGTAAQFIALPSRQAVRLPDATSFEAGACLGIPAITAWRAVFYDGPPTGQTIFIPGGAGAVAHYAIQFAKRAGAEVITSVSSTEKAAHAYAAGADAIIDYKKESVADRLMNHTSGRGVDRMLDLNMAANAPDYTKYVRPEGSVIIYGSDDWAAPLPMADFLVHGLRLGIFIIYNLPDPLRRQAVSQLGHHLEQDLLQHKIADRFPLDRIVDAHEAQEAGGHIGNIILDIP